MKHTFIQTIRDALGLLWKDIKDVKWAIILLIAYFALGKNYLYSLCPVVAFTGFPCPGCGLTRAGFMLLRLDFAGAFQIHPFIYPIVFYIVLFSYNRYIKKRRMGDVLKLLLITIMALIIVFYIWRMVNYFPGDPPMSYYRRNLIHLLLFQSD